METARNYRMEPYGSMHGIAWKPYEFGSGLLSLNRVKILI